MVEELPEEQRLQLHQILEAAHIKNIFKGKEEQQK
jgi:hypothetical protein